VLSCYGSELVVQTIDARDMLFDVTCGQVCEDMELSCESVINGSASEVIGVGACDASTAAAIKARISFRRAVHR
jgi:hypothetical protein